MEIKLFEVRDIGTFISVIAIRPVPRSEEERYLLSRCGYQTPKNYLLLSKLDGDQMTYDPYSWGIARTMRVAHLYIQKHFDELKSGDMVDVEFILGESTKPKKSERLQRLFSEMGEPL